MIKKLMLLCASALLACGATVGTPTEKEIPYLITPDLVWRTHDGREIQLECADVSESREHIADLLQKAAKLYVKECVIPGESPHEHIVPSRCEPLNTIGLELAGVANYLKEVEYWNCVAQ